MRIFLIYFGNILVGSVEKMKFKLNGKLFRWLNCKLCEWLLCVKFFNIFLIGLLVYFLDDIKVMLKFGWFSNKWYSFVLV